jgi:hypothetical protein
MRDLPLCDWWRIQNLLLHWGVHVHIFVSIFLLVDGSTVGRHISSTKGQPARQVAVENRENVIGYAKKLYIP